LDFDQNFNLKFRFLTKISIWDQNFNFDKTFHTGNDKFDQPIFDQPIFDQNFDFKQNGGGVIQCLAEILILTKISI